MSIIAGFSTHPTELRVLRLLVTGKRKLALGRGTAPLLEFFSALTGACKSGTRSSGPHMSMQLNREGGRFPQNPLPLKYLAGH